MQFWSWSFYTHTIIYLFNHRKLESSYTTMQLAVNLSIQWLNSSKEAALSSSNNTMQIHCAA